MLVCKAQASKSQVRVIWIVLKGANKMVYVAPLTVTSMTKSVANNDTASSRVIGFAYVKSAIHFQNNNISACADCLRF
jgi:hypothetical protein